MTIENQFVHLHVHTEFSLLDGLSRIDQLVARAQVLHMHALAITDHGTMFGIMDFYRACKDAGIKPIIGVEAYVARNSRFDRDPKLDKRAYHLLLLAKNETGYRNLLKIASEGQLNGYYYRPRIDREFLAAHADGLIATSGCLAAQIPGLVVENRDEEARNLMGWYQDVFGAENYFLELQQHDIPELETLNKWLYDQRGYAQISLLATNDVHYVLPSEYDPHDTLLCIQTSTLKNDANRLRMSDSSYHLTTQEEMWGYFKDVPEALANTLRVADMCEVNLDQKGYHLPIFPVPEGADAASYLRYLCEKGLHQWRFADRSDDPALHQRLDHELTLIHEMGFDSYFLIVWDLCQYARHADIWWNVRGSGAGSLVAYCLGITNIDPIANNLLFERFLNPGRVSMPDIDLDFPDDRREEMISYTARRYGEDKVAAIITFGTMGAKAAVRDVGRALNVSLDLVNQTARLIPTEVKQKPIMQYVEDNPELKSLYQSNEDIQRVIDTAAQLQGVSRHASTHAAGIIVADKPLVEYLPLHRPTKVDAGKGEERGETALKMVTQFTMETCDSIGLLKIDFLGLSTLTIMRKACELIEQHHGVRYTMDNVPYQPTGDPEKDLMLEAAFELLGNGDTVGVFQMESGGMQQMLREMRPTRFEHIVAGISLYRPGPMDFIPLYNARMHGREEIKYKHEKLEEILGETYGILVYQEQIMQIASELFGYELGEADLMRRAISKKKDKDLKEHRAIFVERGPHNGVDEATASAIFDEIDFFANYGFNKSHAADYGVITCQTAFLKAQYRVEYMTALLSVHRDDIAKISTFLDECKRHEIPILSPDVNYSMLDFAIQKQPDGSRGIRFGLAAIKNAGVAPLQHIIDVREQDGPFTSLEDFCRRVDMRLVQKRTLESLVKVGALRAFGSRAQLLAALERMVSFSADVHKAREVGQMSLFGASTGVADDMLDNLPEVGEVSEREMLAWEKELLGFYITSRPADKYKDAFQAANTASVRELKEAGMALHNKPVKIGGEVVALRKIITKTSQIMAVAQVEGWRDSGEAIDVVLFPRTWEKFQDNVAEGEVVMVMGKVDASRGDVQIICDEVMQNFAVLTVENGPSEPPVPIPPAWTYDDEEFYEEEPDDVPVAQEVSEPDTVAVTAPVTQSIGSVVVPALEPQLATAPVTPEPAWWDDDGDLPGPLVFPGEEHVSPGKQWLMLHFQRSDDDEKDRRRLRKLVGILSQYPGKDRFTIVVEGRERDALHMEFPNHTTDCCPALLDKLAHLVGEANVRVMENPN